MNRQRNAAMDVARGFTVLIMPAVHSVLMYSKESVRKGKAGKILGFLAEGPGAQLFLLLMGASVAFGRKKQNSVLAGRAFKLLISGYWLNAIRLVPMYRNKLPQQFFLDNHVPNNLKGRKQLLLSGDILHSAAIAYPVCAVLRRNKYYPAYSLMLGVFINFISPKLWNVQSKYSIIRLPLHLLTGKPPKAFFPVFPWMTYSLIGLVFGYYLKKETPGRLYPSLAIIGCCLLFVGKKMAKREPEDWKTSFYRLGPGGTLYHTGIVLLWLCLCYLSVKRMKRTRLFVLLNFLSRNITPVYFIQWILIFWLLPFLGYRKLNLKQTLLSIAFTTSSTFTLTYLSGKLYREIQNRKR